MPRSIEEILAHADELATKFENFERRDEDYVDGKAYIALRAVVHERADVEQRVVEAVQFARERGTSWAKIGRVLGTTGEAARQRYGSKIAGSMDS